MIISREELYLRWSFRNFKTLKTVVESMKVKQLYKEIKKDAKYRNHGFLFDGSDLKAINLKEFGDEVGVNLHCNANAITEEDRVQAISEQVKNGTYKPVEVFQDIEHPTIIYIDDGFHRIFCAHQLGLVNLKCRIRRGHYILSKSIRMRDLPPLLEMLMGIFGKNKTLKEAKKMASIKKIASVAVSYGNDKEGVKQ